jgi:protein TonB
MSFRRAAALRVAPADPPIYEVGGAVTEPIPLAQPAPEMPQRCYRPGFSATVLFETIIDSDGTVRAIHTLPTAASSPLLETAARSALAHWRYKPATLDGAPVSVYLTLHFTYRVR